MRLNATALGLVVLSALPIAVAGGAQAKPSAQSAHCSTTAKDQGLTGAKRRAFIKTCLSGPLAARTPTAPTASSKESQAVTKPSGVDRTTRTKQCSDEAGRRGLAGKNSKAFQLSCLATAGPPSEGETGVTEPHPANQIKGIGVNNYKPSSTTAKSTPAAPKR